MRNVYLMKVTNRTIDCSCRILADVNIVELEICVHQQILLISIMSVEPNQTKKIFSTSLTRATNNVCVSTCENVPSHLITSFPSKYVDQKSISKLVNEQLTIAMCSKSNECKRKKEAKEQLIVWLLRLCFNILEFATSGGGKSFQTTFINHANMTTKQTIELPTLAGVFGLHCKLSGVHELNGRHLNITNNVIISDEG